jgi:hypothetical protein
VDSDLHYTSEARESQLTDSEIVEWLEKGNVSFVKADLREGGTTWILDAGGGTEWVHGVSLRDAVYNAARSERGK